MDTTPGGKLGDDDEKELSTLNQPAVLESSAEENKASAGPHR